MPLRSKSWVNIPGFDAIKEKYVQLDLGRWLKEHAIEEQGRKSGAINKPSPSDTTLDGVESQIVAWINERGRVCREDVSGHLKDLANNLTDMEDEEGLSIRERQVGQHLNDAEMALERKVGDGRNELKAIEDDVLVGKADYEDFRQRSRLTRLPDYSHRESALKIIISCFLVELVFNATLLMEVNAFGLLGSIGQMALIGAVNVLGLGFCMGFSFRQFAHIAVPRKLFSAIGFVVILSLVILFNLSVAHYRDSMQAVLSDPSADVFSLGNDALQRFAENPLGLDSFQSALLALVGMMFFAIAAWKWWQRDDAYPDYGRRHRRLKESQKEYILVCKRAQDALRSAYESFENRLQDIEHSLKIKKTQWREMRLRGNQLVNNYSMMVQQYQRDLDFLLSAYRTANLSTRTDPAPVHYSQQVQIDHEISLPPEFDPPVATSLLGVAGEVDKAIRQLQDVYQRSMRQYRSLEVVLTEASGTPGQT